MIEIEIIRIREIRTEMSIKSYLLDDKSINDNIQNDDDIDDIILLFYYISIKMKTNRFQL